MSKHRPTMLSLDGDLALGTQICFVRLVRHYTLRFNEVERGVYWFHVRPPVRLPVCGKKSCLFVAMFYPRPVLAFEYCRCLRLSVCVSVCVCINHLLVRAITHHPFKLGSPNFDHRCKRSWLRSLFWGGDWPLPSRPNVTSKSKFTPFWAHHLFNLGSPNLLP